MIVDIKYKDNMAVAFLNGEIDHHSAKEIRSQLDNYIITVQPEIFAIDLSGITFMDSSGIGLILGRSRLLQECGGRLEIINPQPYIKRVLRLSGIDIKFGIKNM
jgi:stage II sporulation protein AA (anti-sigma F factor antagonist)